MDFAIRALMTFWAVVSEALSTALGGAATDHVRIHAAKEALSLALSFAGSDRFVSDPEARLLAETFLRHQGTYLKSFNPLLTSHEDGSIDLPLWKCGSSPVLRALARADTAQYQSLITKNKASAMLAATSLCCLDELHSSHGVCSLRSATSLRTISLITAARGQRGTRIQGWCAPRLAWAPGGCATHG